MKKIFSAAPLWFPQGMTLIRIITGFFMIYHGWELFDATVMNGYLKWDTFKSFSSPAFVVYLGKAAELAGGILLLFGFLTRLACILIAGTMLYISLFVGHGKVWYDDQHPFLFVLLALVFFFAGAGKWSVDSILSRNNS